MHWVGLQFVAHDCQPLPLHQHRFPAAAVLASVSCAGAPRRATMSSSETVDGIAGLGVGFWPALCWREPAQATSATTSESGTNSFEIDM
jgi:hypothetical protein